MLVKLKVEKINLMQICSGLALVISLQLKKIQNNFSYNQGNGKYLLGIFPNEKYFSVCNKFC